jgi:hypothetical protein
VLVLFHVGNLICLENITLNVTCEAVGENELKSEVLVWRQLFATTLGVGKRLVFTLFLIVVPNVSRYAQLVGLT